MAGGRWPNCETTTVIDASRAGCRHRDGQQYVYKYMVIDKEQIDHLSADIKIIRRFSWNFSK